MLILLWWCWCVGRCTRCDISSGRAWAGWPSVVLLVSVNWCVFVWALLNERMLETSLGYYINPLVNVVLGMVFLGERLRCRPGDWQ